MKRARSPIVVSCAELRQLAVQADVKEMKFPDRTTQTGQLISKYLADGMAMEDHAIHLLFSANRWESKCGPLSTEL